MKMNRSIRDFGSAFLAAVFLLGGCATDSDEVVVVAPQAVLRGLAMPDSYIVTEEGVSSDAAVKGAADIDSGIVRRGKPGKSAEKSFGSAALDRLDRVLRGEGGDFDPNDVAAPDYDAPVYRSDVNKKLLLDELMSSAYDAYKKVTGDKWYPRRAITDAKTQSRDPRLNPNWWQVHEGDDLHNTLSKWSRRAGWRVVWKLDEYYPIEVNAFFKGDFPQAVRWALAAFEKQAPSIQAVFYKNRVVVINDSESEG